MHRVGSTMGKMMWEDERCGAIERKKKFAGRGGRDGMRIDLCRKGGTRLKLRWKEIARTTC